MSTQAQLDAAFYEMVHRMLQAEEEDSERRDNDRHQFCYNQLIAPYDGHTLPDPEDFVPLPLNDLSSGGFSFYTPEKPQTENVVVALGKPPYKLFAAEIRHSTQSYVEGRTLYLIGCQLYERIEQVDANLWV